MNRQDIFIPILAGTILFFVISFFINVLILLFKERRKQHEKQILLLQQSYEQALLQSRNEVQESTYQHIARELHDNVGQLLSTTKMLIGVTQINMGKVPETLFTANDTLSKAILELRQVSRSLDKEWLQQFNFLENIQTEIDRINSAGLLKSELNCTGDILLKPEEQIVLFRIVQEAIQNALKHGAPTYLKINIQNEDQLIVKIINDGHPLPETIQGMGTRNMMQRVKLFGGHIQWGSSENYTEVIITFPLNKEI